MIKDICVNLCTPLKECIDGIVCTRGVKVNVASPSIIVENIQATITCDTTGVTIKYTLDGSTPSATNGTTYSSAINLTQNCTIKAIAIKGNNVSAVAEYIYTMPIVNTPVITITDNSVTISCYTTGAIIYYTLDGTTPTTSSTQYTSAIALTQSCTIKAIAVKSGMTNSSVAEEEYVKPITYLTQWKIVGNSEVHGQEIWSCGEYNPIDGKWHILVQPQGGSIADIALTEPLRKVNSVADTIEFPSDTEGKALVTRPLKIVDWSDVRVIKGSSPVTYFVLYDSGIKIATNNILSAIYPTYNYNTSPANFGGLGVASHGTGATIRIVNENMDDLTADQFKAANDDVVIIYELTTPITELVDAPQIEEADSYTCVISQGAKAVEWTEFVVNPT